MSAYRSSLFRSLKKEVSEKLPQGKSATRAEEKFVRLALGVSGACPWNGPA